MQGFEGDESMKPSDPKAIKPESSTQDKEQNVVEHIHKRVSNEQFMLLESVRDGPLVIKVPFPASTPNQPVLLVLNRKEASFSPNAMLYVQAILPKQDYLTRIHSSLRGKVPELAHECHQGPVKCKQRLRSKVWWPRLDQDVEGIYKSREFCQLVAGPDPPVQPAEP